MNLNLSKFKKMKEDASTATLQHPAGHTFQIAKKSLSPSMQKELGSLPMHLQDGGEVPEEQSAPDQKQPTIIINNGPQPQAQLPMPEAELNPIDSAMLNQQMNAGARGLQNPQIAIPLAAQKDVEAENAADANLEQSKEEAQKVSPEQMTAQKEMALKAAQDKILGNAPPLTENPGAEPTLPNAPSTPAPSAVNDPYGTEAYYKTLSQGVDAQKQGLAGEAEALGAQGKEEAAALQPAIQQQQEQIKTYQDHYQNLEGEYKDFISDLQNQHIDSQHYLNSMGTGQKVATAIGLILGGMGGGLMHQENPALKFLNAQIDRDVEAQRMELGRKENLLNANMRQFGNLRDATDMTRAMQLGIVSNQLKMAAANNQDPLARARALQGSGKIDEQIAPILSQMAARRTLMGGGSMNPSVAVRMLVPEGQQASVYKELQMAENMAHQKDNLLGAFDQLNQINTLGNRITSPIQTSKQVSTIREPLLAQLVKDAEGRITPQDVEMLRGLFPATGDDSKTIQTKRIQMNKFVSEKMNFPMLKAYGINPTENSRYSNAGQKTIQLRAPVQ